MRLLLFLNCKPRDEQLRKINAYLCCTPKVKPREHDDDQEVRETNIPF